MPRMDKAPASERLIKLLLIGDGKIGKTYYAGKAAEAGFNVLYMDGDVGAQTLTLLPPVAQQRIYLLSVGDTVLSGRRDYKFIENFTRFSTEPKFRWNDTQQKEASVSDPKSDEQWEIVPAWMGSDTVFVLDSWTGLTESMMLKAATLANLRISEATTEQMRPVYQSSGLMATTALQLIRALNCHVIVIAHPDEFTHTTKAEGRKMRDASKEGDLMVDWTKMIPKSTSKPHGLQMTKYFTDVAWAGVSPAGNERRLDFRLKQNRVGGGHFDGEKSVDDYSFANLVKQVGGTIPDPTRPTDLPGWLKIIPPASESDTPPPELTVLDGTNATKVQGTGIANIFGKPKA